MKVCAPIMAYFPCFAKASTGMNFKAASCSGDISLSCSGAHLSTLFPCAITLAGPFQNPRMHFSLNLLDALFTKCHDFSEVSYRVALRGGGRAANRPPLLQVFLLPEPTAILFMHWSPVVPPQSNLSLASCAARLSLLSLLHPAPQMPFWPKQWKPSYG